MSRTQLIKVVPEHDILKAFLTNAPEGARSLKSTGTILDAKKDGVIFATVSSLTWTE